MASRSHSWGTNCFKKPRHENEAVASIGALHLLSVLGWQEQWVVAAIPSSWKL
jgi:hypothetical protein